MQVQPRAAAAEQHAGVRMVPGAAVRCEFVRSYNLTAAVTERIGLCIHQLRGGNKPNPGIGQKGLTDFRPYLMHFHGHSSAIRLK